MIPFGHDYVTLIIQDGHVKSAARTGSDAKFSFFCGYVVVMHNKGPGFAITRQSEGPPMFLSSPSGSVGRKQMTQSSVLRFTNDASLSLGEFFD